MTEDSPAITSIEDGRLPQPEEWRELPDSIRERLEELQVDRLAVLEAEADPTVIDSEWIALLLPYEKPYGGPPILNDQQRAAVNADSPRILVVAGAGTGKTAVLASRVARLLRSGTSPYSILAMTFTRRAAAEMAQRVKALSGFEAGDSLWLGTVHSIAYRMVVEYGFLVGYDGPVSIYGPDDTKHLVDQILTELGLKISGLKVLDALSDPATKGADLKRVVAEYRRRLKVSQALDYDGLLRVALDLLDVKDVDDQPHLYPVRSAYRSRFKHVLVDEVQDLMPEAWALIEALAPENLFLVGDDAQSIYSFAGADLERFFACVKAGFSVFKLERNYRCTEDILALGNRILEKNVRQIRKTLVTEKKGDAVAVVGFQDEREEAQFIAATIRDMAEVQGIPWQNQAVLCRTNDLVGAISEQLTAHRIPVQMVGGADPFATDTGRVLTDLLRLIVNPHDEFALRRSLLAAGLDVRRLAWVEVQRHTQGCSLYEAALQLPDRDPARLALALVTGAVPLGADAVKVLEYMVAGCRRVPALIPYLAPVHVVPIERSIRGWQKGGGQGVRDLLVFLATRAAIDLYEPEQEAVAVLTIHSAKGLEWPVVFVPGWEEGMLPHQAAMRSPQEVEEERRVAHVAVTRAADRLYCTWVERRKIYQREFQRIRSKLLEGR